jgi:prepilin peptidase CpaA
VDLNNLHTFGFEPFPFIVLLGLLLIASYIDLKYYRIPNYLTFAGMIGALTLYSTAGGLNGFLFSLKGISVGIGVLLIPYLMGGMGAGDAKLMGVVGGFLGAKSVLGVFMLTAAFGGIYAIVIAFIFREKFKNFFKNFRHSILILLSTRDYVPEPADCKTERPRLCYGLAIALGTVSYMLIDYLGYSFIS